MPCCCFATYGLLMTSLHSTGRQWRRKCYNHGKRLENQTAADYDMEIGSDKSKILVNIPTKIKPYKSLVVSIMLYGCESWTLMADLER